MRARYLHVVQLLAVAGALIFSAAAADEARWEMRVCADPSSLPFSSVDGSGFENQIAGILARQLGAYVTYDWHYFNSDIVNRELRAGNCDLLLGVPDGYAELLTTITYYQSPYVLFYRADAGYQITSFDDPILAQLRIGVQSSGIPPQSALIQRGLGRNVVADFGADYTSPDRLNQVVRAVADGQIDVGLSWGPQVGYYVDELGLDLTVVPITPEFDPTSLPMTVPMTIAVRPGDIALRDALNAAIAARWPDIQAVLERFHVPTQPLPPPAVADLATDGNVLRIGLVVPTRTGPSAVPEGSLYDVVGQAAWMGGQLAADGIMGRSQAAEMDVKLLLASSPSAEAAARAANRLLQVDQVAGLVGGLGAGQARTLSALAEDAEVPFMNIGSPAEELRSHCLKATFNIEASAGMYLTALADWFAGHDYSRWFIVSEATAEGARLLRSATRAVAGVTQAAVVGTAEVPVGAPDYGPTLAKARRSEADLVLLLLNAPDQIAFLAQQQSIGPHIAVAPFPFQVTQARDFLGATRVRAAEQGLGVRAALWEPTLRTPEAQDLNGRFVSRWGQPMDPAAWAAYAAVDILYGAAVAAGSTEPQALTSRLLDPGAVFDVGKEAPLAFDPVSRQLGGPLYMIEVQASAPLTVQLQDQLDLAELVGVVDVGPKLGADGAPLALAGCPRPPRTSP